MTGPKELIDKLHKNQELSLEEWTELIKNRTPELSEYLFELAREERHKYYGHDVYVRGLIEFTNYCKNNCYYRLDEDTILRCCQEGYDLGFRTFVLQGGEDGYFTEERIIHIVRRIREHFPQCAITLSIGEWKKDSYQAFFDAGADRYLLRHETYNPEHYAKLHPPILSAAHRQQCLWDLKDIGYQVGTGFMVGAPFQTPEYLAEDMLFLKELNPHMVGIGPFIPHHDTPFADQPAGTLELTLFMLGLIRLMLPKVLLPATTALGTIHPKGRHCLERRMASVGYQVVTSRGDSLNI